MKGKLFKFNNVICAALAIMAPVIVNKTACVLIFGEPKCPEHLKTR
ncbi:cyclic lactone autoinducer peptide [Dethiosulfatibacter aminovorans DSM 17477]|uniref:Cyclic lactone autoinducer peptide n=1 Tax=Dethiosulfatibacter aminovorans DSM 17477 TaxID=1121476 RepID=A0A1M6IJA7_9FIRM|nr:cyclic lactone autoinducer peptide [Dethiosulfatibacter aminovorans]SHJ34516.1 cyclic lactone autoinducer peptide [Dethiosulfatibacter aminovorans DSM 17477]